MSATSAAEIRDDLVPIHMVARRFGLKASTLRYYERRGLIEPASRHGGRRWYGPREIRRLAIILFWQRSNLMSLDAVAMIIDRSSTGGLWQEVVTEHLSDLRARIEAMQRVESFVAQSLDCKHHECLDECPDYEELIWETLEAALPSTGADVAAIKRLGTQDRVPVQPRVPPGPKG